MAKDHDLEKIERWIAQGELTRDRIMSRLDSIVQKYAIASEDKQALQDGFASACSRTSSGDNDVLTETAFISLLQSKSGLPHNPEGVEAGKIIYEMLAYLSTLPLPTRPSPQTEGLNLAQITRALAWALSDRTGYILVESNHSRKRTRSDHKRLLFQSLADSTVLPAIQGQVRQHVSELAHRNMFDIDECYHEICRLNNDADGDEIYYDLLEVLFSTQEEVSPWMSTVPLDKFRGIAKQIKVDEGLPELHTLSISVPRFQTFVKVMLALQFEPVTSEHDVVELTHFDGAARCICAAFIQNQDEFQDLDASISRVNITWPSFCQALEASSPYLLYPFYRLLTLAFLDKPCTVDIIDSSERIPHIPADAVLTRPRASQLNTFLAHSVYGPDLRRMGYYISPNLPTPAALVQAIQDLPDEAVVLFSGRPAGTRIGLTKGENYVFGLFSPKPKEDRFHILATADFRPNADGQQQCTLFQLSPRQDTFQGVPGAAGWSMAAGNESLIFGRATSIDDIEGEKGGVVFIFRDGLNRAEVRHRGKGVDVDGKVENVTYKANPNRGDWIVDFDIDQIEIWSEIE
ncbi:uncharacterized protein F4812DRAFT_448027 [Daldinia caldariorum]|uniref:uncharacterized protein n=1 Tax=Daldinia caldariorum TaxID=326644 RepID=UPI00200896D6|nr:uncharacterized protein F4812DRAFT_448027 [Daldinia caldariorum]KAI1463097.1 hypothetical protein F4812DRAFT_448027 [Daldinia caldariorum]